MIHIETRYSDNLDLVRRTRVSDGTVMVFEGSRCPTLELEVTLSDEHAALDLMLLGRACEAAVRETLDRALAASPQVCGPIGGGGLQ